MVVVEPESMRLYEPLAFCDTILALRRSLIFFGFLFFMVICFISYDRYFMIDCLMIDFFMIDFNHTIF